MNTRPVFLWLDNADEYPTAAAMIERAYLSPWPAVCALLILVVVGLFAAMDALWAWAVRW